MREEITERVQKEREREESKIKPVGGVAGERNRKTQTASALRQCKTKRKESKKKGECIKKGRKTRNRELKKNFDRDRKRVK